MSYTNENLIFILFIHNNQIYFIKRKDVLENSILKCIYRGEISENGYGVPLRGVKKYLEYFEMTCNYDIIYFNFIKLCYFNQQQDNVKL